MTTKIDLELTAKDVVRGVERGDILVIIDALRCSSTIVTSLANGAKSVVPVGTLKEALKFQEAHMGCVLAGERKGLKPKGFDLGNSPLEFVSEKVAGKHIVMTTTSGTRALIYSRRARWVLIGAFLNAEAVARKSLEIAERESVDISLIASGRKGSFSLEDFLCAGAIIENLRNKEVRLSDAAATSSFAFQRARDHLYECVLRGEHAQDLVNLGFEGDVEFCCRIDYYPSTVPFYRDGVITLLP